MSAEGAYMIASVQFRNFKVLRNAELPLSRFTLLVGPNGSGKSTALQAFHIIQMMSIGDHMGELFHSLVTVSEPVTDEEEVIVEIVLHWGAPYAGIATTVRWSSRSKVFPLVHQPTFPHVSESHQYQKSLDALLAGIRIYTLNATAIQSPVMLEPHMELGSDGGRLAGVLDRLRDLAPERFNALNEEIGRWLPDYDRVLFDTPIAGNRAFSLRTRQGHYKIHAGDLSQGTLLALALLTLAYLPDPPSIVCLEEPDRGIHPRLLRDVQDALYRLSYPESFDEMRPPVQVLATTHSPYFLDLYRDHPEEVVIASRIGQEARFERLSDHPHLHEVLGDAPLSEIWYSGILGGVPAER
jgi:predicted ATPase